jgi:integrase
MPRLTKRIVDAAKPGGRDMFIWCSDLRGFGLRIYPTGAKVYLVQWKRDGRTRRLVLGRHGPMTTEEARKAALAALAEVQKGNDPAAERNARKRDLTVAELADLWLAEGCGGKKASTLAMDRSRLAAHVLPLIGRIKVRALTRADVDRFARDVIAGRTARQERTGPRGRRIVTGGAGVAARTLGMMGAMFEFAVARGMRSDNPFRRMKRAASPERDRFLSPAELARLGEALAAAEAAGMAWQAVSAVRLLALTGCRRNEVLHLQWEHVDLEAGRLLLADSKTGRSVRPLAAPAHALLAALHERSAGSPWVLPSERNEGPYIGLQKQWARIRQLADLGDVRLHDLRHNLASTAVAGGDSLFIIGKMLGHRKARSTERYAHLADDPVRAVADRTANRIAAALAGGAGGDAAAPVEILRPGRRGE